MKLLTARVMVLFVSSGFVTCHAVAGSTAVTPALQKARALCIAGVDAYEANDFSQAIHRWSEALRICRTSRATEWEQAEYLEDIADALEQMKQYPEAAEKYEQALRLYQNLEGATEEWANCRLRIGTMYANMGKNWHDVETQIQQAGKTLNATVGSQRRQAGASLSQAGLFLKDNMPDRALAKFQEALQFYEIVKGAKTHRAHTYLGIGDAFLQTGRYRLAAENYQHALDLFSTFIHNRPNQILCLAGVARAQRAVGKYKQALATLDQAGLLLEKLDWQKYRADCCKILGLVLIDLDHYEAGLTKQQEALAIYQGIEGTELDQAGCQMNIGGALLLIGKPEEAIQRQQLAAEIYQRSRSTQRQQAACQLNIGNALLEMGACEHAGTRYAAALGLLKAVAHTERDRALACVAIGHSLLGMHDFQGAMVQYESALRIYETLEGTQRQQSECHENMGVAAKNLDSPDQAVEEFKKALELRQAMETSERAQAHCWGNIGWAHLKAGRLSEAIKAFESAQRIQRFGWVCAGLGAAYHQLGRPGDASRAVRQFLDAVQWAEAKRTSVIAYEHRVGIFEESFEVFPDFVGVLVDLMTRNVRIQDAELSRWAQGSKSPTALVEAAFHFAERGKGRALLDMLREKSVVSTARTDAKLLAEDRTLSRQISRLSSLREGLPMSEAEGRNELSRQLDALQQRRYMIEVEVKKTAVGGYVAPEFQKPLKMAKELPSGTAVLEYSVGGKEVWLLLMTRTGITAHRLGADTPALPELRPRQQATLSQLVAAWKERPDKLGLEGWVRLARARAEDQGKPEHERHNLVNAATEQAILECLGGIVLPESAQAELKRQGIKHLLVVSDGPLHYLPLAMVRLKGATNSPYLVEQYAVSSVPALTTLEAIRKQKLEREQKRRGPRKKLLAFANPAFGSGVASASDDFGTRVRSIRREYYGSGGLKLTSLPETEQEALRVASLFGPPKEFKSPTSDWPEGPVAVYAGNGADEAQVKRLLGGLPENFAIRNPQSAFPHWRYVLFGTHGFADERNGMLSCLALSSPGKDSEEDGYLQAQEVLGLQLDTDLVMLSACQTGLGQMHGGEGLVGLSAAFFIAGAESVCASLWQVPSGPTSQVVTEFFKSLKEGKLDRAESLRQAQLKVMRKGQSPDDKSADYSSPFCWAAFVLNGEYLPK